MFINIFKRVYCNYLLESVVKKIRPKGRILRRDCCVGYSPQNPGYTVHPTFRVSRTLSVLPFRVAWASESIYKSYLEIITALSMIASGVKASGSAPRTLAAIAGLKPETRAVPLLSNLTGTLLPAFKFQNTTFGSA